MHNNQCIPICRYYSPRISEYKEVPYVVRLAPANSPTMLREVQYDKEQKKLKGKIDKLDEDIKEGQLVPMDYLMQALTGPQHFAFLNELSYYNWYATNNASAGQSVDIELQGRPKEKFSLDLFTQVDWMEKMLHVALRDYKYDPILKRLKGKLTDLNSERPSELGRIRRGKKFWLSSGLRGPEEPPLDKYFPIRGLGSDYLWYAVDDYPAGWKYDIELQGLERS